MENNIIIIKIGTGVIVNGEKMIRIELLEAILKTIQTEMVKGKKIVLVSSGAVFVGRKLLGDVEASRRLAGAVGNPYLMAEYEKIAEKYNLIMAELLLSRPHITERSHFLQLQESIAHFFSNKILPIINENDALVYNTGWSFGDNDTLAAALAISFGASKLLILTHIDGLYTSDPTNNNGAELITRVENINVELMKYCSEGSSETGMGGMVSKLKAARICTNVGIVTQIINGLKPEVLQQALQDKEVGTLCLPRQTKRQIKNKERWILAAKSSAAMIEVDNGAAKALQEGRSLLAVGIKQIYGSFETGESVEIVNEKKEGIAFGLSDHDSQDLLETEFSQQYGRQVMHADNIIFFD